MLDLNNEKVFLVSPMKEKEILTNILDNAFEAVEKVTEEERKVSFVVKKINESELMIHCENTYNKEVYNNLSFLSTGKDQYTAD